MYLLGAYLKRQPSVLGSPVKNQAMKRNSARDISAWQSGSPVEGRSSPVFGGDLSSKNSSANSPAARSPRRGLPRCVVSPRLGDKSLAKQGSGKASAEHGSEGASQGGTFLDLGKGKTGSCKGWGGSHKQGAGRINLLARGGVGVGSFYGEAGSPLRDERIVMTMEEAEQKKMDQQERWMEKRRE